MKVNWIAAATMSIAASLGLQLMSNAQSPTYTIADLAQPTDGPPMPPAEARSATDRVPPAPMVEPQAPAEPAAAEEEEEATCDPWRLFCQKECGWNFTGYIAGGYTYNPQQPVDRFNGPTTWMDRSNDFQMTEIYGRIDNPTEYGNCDWDMGGRVDMLYGTNYRWTTSAGLESKWNGNDFYGLSLPAAYLEFAKCDWKIKVGHFVSPVGYYTVGTGYNFFNLIPYTYQYGEPFTHTGVYGTYNASDELELGIGVTNGWDSTANWDPTGTALGNAGVTDPWNRHVGLLATATKKNLLCEGDALAWVGTYGLEPDITFADRTPRYFQTLVYTRPLNEKTQYILQSDFGTQARALGQNSAEWYGVNQYLYYTHNDCWAFGANFEWFRDDDGFRVGTVLPSFGSPNARGLARGPFEGDFFRLMAGPRWTPTSNLTIRPTIVFDWYSGPGAGGLSPYDDGNSNNQFLLNLDAVVVF